MASNDGADPNPLWLNGFQHRADPGRTLLVRASSSAGERENAVTIVVAPGSHGGSPKVFAA